MIYIDLPFPVMDGKNGVNPHYPTLNRHEPPTAHTEGLCH